MHFVLLMMGDQLCDSKSLSCFTLTTWIPDKVELGDLSNLFVDDLLQDSPVLVELLR